MDFSSSKFLNGALATIRIWSWFWYCSVLHLRFLLVIECNVLSCCCSTVVLLEGNWVNWLSYCLLLSGFSVKSPELGVWAHIVLKIQATASCVSGSCESTRTQRLWHLRTVSFTGRPLKALLFLLVWHCPFPLASTWLFGVFLKHGLAVVRIIQSSTVFPLPILTGLFFTTLH